MTTDFTRLGLRLGTPKRQAEKPKEEDGVLIGHAEDGRDVYWPRATREQASHAAVFGGSGSGKTEVVTLAAVGEVIRPRPVGEPRPSLVVVDAKGDKCAADLRMLAARAPERLPDVNYLNPFAPGGFSFNLNRLSLGKTPIDIRALQIAQVVDDVSTSTGGQKHLRMGARQLALLTTVIRAALAVPHARASLLLALEALASQRGLQALGAITTDERAKAFLLEAEVGEELRASTEARFRSAMAASDSLTAMIGAPDCISLADLTAPGKITLVDLGRPIGGLSSLQTFYAGLIVRLVIEHLLERPSPYQGHHCRLVIDEAQVVAPVLADRAESVLTLGRSKGLSLTTITQGTTLLQSASDTLLRVIMTNAPVKLVGRLAAPDAELFARERAPGAGVEESLSAFRAKLVSTITNLPDRTFILMRPGGQVRFKTLDVDLAAEEAALERHAAEIAALKARFAVPKGAPPPVTLAELASERPKQKRAGAPKRRSRWG